MPVDLQFADPAWSKLGEEEKNWAAWQPWLAERGYMLRPRYHPGWSIPEGTSPDESETAIPGHECRVLDATRISDGAHVLLKWVSTLPSEPETQIARFLTDEPGAHAHVVPMVDLIPAVDGHAFMVMPLMRPCDDPPFATVGEFVEFVEQVLEGLVFLHSRNIAHRDICVANIVMDASQMVSSGFHFKSTLAARDGKTYLRPYTGDDLDPFVIKSRTQAAPMKYYFIDFELSVRFPSYETRELVTGRYGQLRKHIPEISDTIPYDPFKVDIRLVGEMLRSEFVMVTIGLDFVIPFIHELRHNDPAQRPDAPQAKARFHHLVSKMSAAELAEPIDRLYSLKFDPERRGILALKGL
ncbi:kinase-like domain-containing protein [Mycena polygramma]|nr:kinase-like domain-containing protein [Mycena polygramma]